MKYRFTIRTCLMMLAILMCTASLQAQSWQIVTPKYAAKEAIVAGFVADAANYGNGSTDATTYIQNCLNTLDNASGDPEHGGGVLYLPEGKYKITGTIIVPKGITIRGDWQKPVKGQPISGTILMAYSGKGNADGTPFITMKPGAAVIDLAFWYPEQDASNITPYPHTIQFGAPNYFGNEFCNAKNITLVNSYSGIFFYRGGGTCPTMNGIYGTPLKQGIEIDRIVDIGRTEWVDFSPAYWAGSGLSGAPALSNTAYTKWIYDNGSGIIMRRNDWSYTCYVNIEGYNKGFYATKTVDANETSTPNGHNYGFTLTNCKYGVYFDGDNTVGIMFTEIKIVNCEYGVYATANTGGILQLYKWNVTASNAAIFSDKTSTTKITMQESTIATGKVQLQGGLLIATDNDFNNTAPQIQFEINSRGNLTGNRFKNTAQISETSVFVNKIDNAPVATTKLPAYYEFIPLTKKPSRNVMYNVVQTFGVTKGTRTAIPAADATAGIQNALNQASTDGGGIVYLPPGHYRINGSLTIPSNVELKGSVDVAEFPMGPGSVLEVYGSKGNENGTPCIQMKQGSGLRGVVFNYPDQVYCTVLPNSVLKFPYTVQVQGSDAYIVNVGFRAAYRAVDLFTYKCDRFYLDFLTGQVFNGGSEVGNGSTDGIIANMQFNTIAYNAGDETKFGSWPNSDRTSCASDPTKNPYNYNATNLDFLVVGNAPNILLYNDFNYDANHGLILKDGASGTAIGLGLDGDRTGILVDGNANFNFINTQNVALNYDALGGEQSSYIKTTANYTTGSINLYSSDYWGQATSSGIVMNGAGTVNMQSANFESPGSQSFANVNNGTLNIGNSVINPKDPLVNGTKVSGVTITGSNVSPIPANAGAMAGFRNNTSGAAPSPTSSLSRTGWIATASRIASTGREAQKSIDGDNTTSWSSGWQNDGVAVWYQVDMITPQTFNEVILDYTGSPNDGPASYNFSVSSNGTTWTQVATGTGPNQMTIISFPTQTARYIRMDKPAAASKGNFLAIHELYVFNLTTATQTPYNASAFAIPGTIEAEQYDNGGEGIAYHDASAANEGDGNFRTGEGVDVGICSAGGLDVGWTNAGEWMEYSVNVASSGLYNIQYAVASGNTGSFHLEMDNIDITGTLTVATTGWQTWQTLTKQNVQLTQGAHILKFTTDGGMNIDKLIFTKVNAPLVPVTMVNPLYHQFTSPLFENAGTGNMYTADPSAHVWADGRLYVYASHDIEPAVGCDRMDRYHVFSTDNMTSWVDHGEILNSSQVSWGRAEGGFMWAPDCAYNPANQTYYFYYPHPSGTDWGSTWKIGVATSKEPAANFVDQGYIAGLESLIDPCVFVDDDGQPYLYHGGGGRCMAGKLDKNDWTKLSGTMQPMQGLIDFHEATWVHKYNGKYYLSHSDNHGDDGNQMKYAVSDSPLGPWTDMGVYMYATGCDTDHGSIVNYKNQWWSFYHTKNFSGQYNLRSVCVDKLYYNPDGSIQPVNNWGTPYNNVTRTVAITNNTTDIALTLEAEDFNDGGMHYGYWDKDAANLGGNTTYRTSSVDIESNAGGVVNLGHLDDGEWLRYTITVAKAGLYDIDCIVASGNAGGGKFHISVNGTNLTGDIAVPNTTTWNNWTTVTAKNIVLQAGTQYIDIRINGGFNLDKFRFRKSAPYSGTAYNGPHNVPGVVEAEDYDNGGTGVAYFDSDAANNSGAGRTTEGVDLENSNGSIHISWSNGGEWAKYTINVLSTGIYTVTIPVATGNNASGTLFLSFDDVYTLPIASINTGSWNTYQTMTINNVELTAGTHVMKLNVGGNINIDKFTFVKNVATGIGSVSASEIATIYPNPSESGLFTINTAQAGLLTITDITGNVVFTEYVSNQTVVDLRAQGVYIATLNSNGNIFRYKLIVNK